MSANINKRNLMIAKMKNKRGARVEDPSGVGDIKINAKSRSSTKTNLGSENAEVARVIGLLYKTCFATIVSVLVIFLISLVTDPYGMDLLDVIAALAIKVLAFVLGLSYFIVTLSLPVMAWSGYSLGKKGKVELRKFTYLGVFFSSYALFRIIPFFWLSVFERRSFLSFFYDGFHRLNGYFEFEFAKIWGSYFTFGLDFLVLIALFLCYFKARNDF